MDEEEKYRLEEADEEKPKTGIAKPLPQKPKRGGKAIVNFLGFSIAENRRDMIVFIITPIITALVDAAIYARITTDMLPDSQIYIFAIPMLAAIPIGLLLHRAGRALIGGFLSAVYFAIIYILFLVSPAFYDPNTGVGDFFISAGAITAGYFFFVTMASLLGAFVGLLLREFF
jgi:hypothetical protein